MRRLRKIIERSGGTWDPEHRQKGLARESGVTQDVFDQEKEQRDIDDKEDIFAKADA